MNRKLALRYGFQLRGSGGVRDVGHDGGGPGQNGGFRILNDGAAAVVVLSNVAPTWRADKLCRFIAARIDLYEQGVRRYLGGPPAAGLIVHLFERRDFPLNPPDSVAHICAPTNPSARRRTLLEERS